MPGSVNVTLIGDSIRLYAQPFVRACLPSRFQLSAPAVNCRSSREVAAGIRGWVPPAAADIVHINCGLHDIRRDPGRDGTISTTEEYLSNLHHVFSYLATTGATTIWATSTPVEEGMHDSAESPRWYQDELIEYNRLSVGLARGFGFRINDLFSRLSEAGLAGLHLPDGVHFSRKGNRLIGAQIAAAVQSAHLDPGGPVAA